MDMMLNSFGLILKLENCYGIFRYRVNDGQLVPINKMFKLYPVVIAVTYVFFLLYFLVKHWITSIDHVDLDSITSMMGKISTIITLVQYLLSIIIFLKQNKKNVRLFKIITSVDRFLNIYNDKYFFKTIHNRLGFQFFIFMFIYTLTCVSFLIREKEFFVYQIFVIAIDFQRYIEAFAFYIFIKILSYRLDVLNNYLHNFISRKNTKPFSVNHKKKQNFFEFNINYIGNVSAENNRLQQLAAAYQKIGEAVILINEVFDIQILISLTSSFTYAIVLISTSIYYYRKSQFGYDVFDMAIQTTFEILVIGGISYICEVLILKRNKTEALVNEIVMDYDLPKRMRLQAKTFMELLEVWPLKVITFEVFVIDIKLMLKFINLLTTYVIVVSQLSHLL